MQKCINFLFQGFLTTWFDFFLTGTVVTFFVANFLPTPPFPLLCQNISIISSHFRFWAKLRHRRLRFFCPQKFRMERKKLRHPCFPKIELFFTFYRAWNQIWEWLFGSTNHLFAAPKSYFVLGGFFSSHTSHLFLRSPTDGVARILFSLQVFLPHDFRSLTQFLT